MIDPGGIPTIPGDMDALTGHATTLRGVGTDFAGTGQRINSTWQGLGGVYHAPEVGQLLAATSPVETISASVGTDLGTVAGALSSYAGEVKQIQAALASLKSQASEFVASTEGDDDWKSDDGKVDRNNQLISAVNTQMAAYFEAQRRCANTINALYGGPQYRADDGDGKQSEGEYGYTADQLNAAAGEDDALPWGKTEEKDRGLLGDVGAFFGGIKDGAVGFVTGLGALIGRDPTTGDWSWGTAGTAWKGLGTFALAAGVYAMPGGAQLDQMVGVPGLERGQLGDTLLTAGKSIIAYDEWGKDKSRAAGMATFNIVSAVVGTKGAGAGLRGAGAVAEGSRIAAVSKAGTVMMHTGEAIGKLPTVTDLAKGIGKHLPNLHLPNFSGTTHINVPHHVDTPPIHTPDTPTVHTPHTPTVHTPDTPNVHTPHADTPAAPRPGSVGDALNHTPTHADPPASTPSAASPSHHTDAPTPHHTDTPAPQNPAHHSEVPNQPAPNSPPTHAGGHTDAPGHHTEEPHQPAAHTPSTHAADHTHAPTQHAEAPSHQDTPHPGPATDHAPPAHDPSPGSHDVAPDHAPGEHAPHDHHSNDHATHDQVPQDHAPGDHGSGSDTSGPHSVDGHSSDALPERLGNQPDGSWINVEHGTRFDLTPEQNSAADQYLASARTAETQISPQIHSLADHIEGARLQGYPDYVVKGEDSFKRKFADNLDRYPHLTQEQVLANIKDSVRYTVEVPSSRYTDDVLRSVYELRARGFENITFKPAWDNPQTYKGVNSTWRDPATGRIFELQFHTPDSFRAKMETHGLYEAERVATTEAERLRAADAQAEVFRKVVVPDHAVERLDELKRDLEEERATLHSDLTQDHISDGDSHVSHDDQPPDPDAGHPIHTHPGDTTDWSAVVGTTDVNAHPAIHAGTATPEQAQSYIANNHPYALDVNASRYDQGVVGSDQNCSRCVYAVDNGFANDAPTSALPWAEGPGWGVADNSFEDYARLLGAEPSAFHRVSSYDAIIREVAAHGEGAHGMVYIFRPLDDSAHVFNVVHDSNGVVFLDGQTGGLAVLEKGVDIMYLPLGR